MSLAVCKKCKKRIHISNLLLSEYCFYCYDKNVYRGKWILNFVESLGKVYQYTPIVSLLAGIIIFLFITQDSRIFSLFTTNSFMGVICFIGSIPHISPSLIQMARDIPQNYDSEKEKYDPNIIEFCLGHSERSASGRCVICFKPFCFEHLLFDRETPYCCNTCYEKYFKIKFTPTIFYFLSVGSLSAMGITTATLLGDYIIIIGFIAYPFVILLLFFVLLSHKLSFKKGRVSDWRKKIQNYPMNFS